MSSSKYTEEFKQEVINFYNLNKDNLFLRDIADHFKINTKRLLYWCDEKYRNKCKERESKRGKFIKLNRRLTIQEIENITQFYTANVNKLSLCEMAKKLNIDAKTLKYHIDKNSKMKKLHYMKEYKTLDYVKEKSIINGTIYRQREKERLVLNPLLHKEKLFKKKLRRLNPKIFISDRISSNMRNSLTNKIKKNGLSWERLVGYNRHILKEYLEKQFNNNVNWNNRDEWHIDHVLPIKMFNYDTYNHPHFKLCWCLENLRPLLAKVNINKNDKIPTDEELEKWFENDPERLNTLKNIKNEVLNG